MAGECYRRPKSFAGRSWLVFIGVCSFIIVAMGLIVASFSRDYSLVWTNWNASRQLEPAVSHGELARVVALLGTRMVAIEDGPCPRTYAAESAADALLQARQKGADAILSYGLRDKDPQVRFMSIRVLGRLGDKRYADEVATVLRKEVDVRVLVYGAETLCLLGRPPEGRKILENVVMREWPPGSYTLFGNRTAPGRRTIATMELIEIVNRRFKLGLDIRR